MEEINEYLDDDVQLSRSAFDDLKEVLEGTWACQPAWDKVASVTSDKRTRKALEQRLTKLIGGERKTAANLGFESTAGRARLGQMRIGKIRRLAQHNRQAAESVFRAGVIPAITFGSQV